jgi:hypothetical protein
MQDEINKILSTVDEAISKFQKGIPYIQDRAFKELVTILKNVDIKNGTILNNVKNLKLIGDIRNKIERILINNRYSESVKVFVSSFDALSSLHNNYFSQFNEKFTPSKTLPIIKQLAIESTVNSLIGGGLKESIVSPIIDILQQNVTTGGSYADMQEVLRNHLITNDTGEGSLERYTKQITTDSINQYNAQYSDVISADLGYEWGIYTGSNLTTTREWCEFMTKKRYFHKSEIKDLLRGVVDGHQCKLSKTTKLPIGMYADTNESNIKIRRGGYKCGHQIFWIPTSSVPKEFLNKIGIISK